MPAMSGGHAAVVHVDADAHDDKMHAVRLGMHLRQNAAALLAAQ